MIILSRSDETACATPAIGGPVGASYRIFGIESMALLAVSFRRVNFPLHRGGPVQVLAMRLRDQVLRLNTGRGVTQVSDLHPLWNRPVVENVREPMRQNQPFPPSPFSHHPVSGRQGMGCPQPTIPRLVYLGPESLFWSTLNHIRAAVRKNIAVTLEAPVVHPAPTALLHNFKTTIYGASHV